MKKIVKGTVISCIITFLLLLIYAVILTYTNLNDNTISEIIIAITGISILIGSSITTSTIKKNGIINGGTIGAIYVLTIYLISSITQSNFAINMYSVIMMMIGIASGAIGGIVRSKYEIKHKKKSLALFLCFITLFLLLQLILRKLHYL